MTIKDCQFEAVKRSPEKRLEEGGRPKGDELISQGLDEESALREAQRCLGDRRCESCNLCQLLCPDMAIIRNDQGELEIDIEFCKGCGICVLVCPKGAIQMVLSP